jgi:ribulose-phosphate 3-epimerase
MCIENVNMKNILLSASILSADFGNLSDQIHQAETAGVNWIHIDVMDGHFVPNITMGPFIVETCRRITKLPLDVHLMIEKPELHIDAFSNAGADRISIHIEGNPNIHRTLQKIRELGRSPGIVINPGTLVSFVQPCLQVVDSVLLMSVNPGFSGQQFISSTIEKIEYLRSYIVNQQLPVLIEVDGGINSTNLSTLVTSGMDIAVVATAIFKHPKGIIEGVQELRDSLK